MEKKDFNVAFTVSPESWKEGYHLIVLFGANTFYS